MRVCISFLLFECMDRRICDMRANKKAMLAAGLLMGAAVLTG